MKLILLMAVTLDGKIAEGPDHFPDWTGKADKRLFVEITRRAGVMIMGSRTYDTIGSPLRGRKNIVMTRDPGRISERGDLVFTDAGPEEILQDLEREGFTEAILAGGTTINSLFAKARLINEIMVTVSPLIFGSGLSLFSEDIAMRLDLIDVRQVDRSVVCLRYRVVE